MPPNKENIQDMGVFANRLDHIDESINSVSKNIQTILDKLGQQNGDLIKAQTEIVYLKKEVQESKEEREKEIKTLWEELRRRDKKAMWTIGMIVPVVTVVISLVIGFFLK